jgi:uncharacterized damage-inducible protein DinB
MKELTRLFREISLLTLNIETNYPELYQFLDENPLTIPMGEDSRVDYKSLNNYLESLKKLLFHHIQEHKLKLKNTNENEILLVSDLSRLSRTIRERTINRLKQLPDGFQNWRLNDTAMSFGDIAQHLINVDNLFLEMIEKENKQYVWTLGTDEPHLKIDRETYHRLISELQDIQNKKEEIINGLGELKLKSSVQDDQGEKISLWWFIMRKLFEHEVYHRGQMSAYLKILKGNQT